jgi:hypothetical protein
LEAIRRDPLAVMRLAGYEPDGWQADLLRSVSDRLAVLTARQCGKSLAVAALALRTALLRPRSLVLLLSPSERQSGEIAIKLFDFYDALGQPVPARKRTELQLHLTNGSRVVALPENERTIRGFSGAALLVIDEAARVSDALYYTVRPMLSVSRGRMVALSTPFGKRGWFYEEWASERRWERVRVTADRCPRHTPEFLAEERGSMGDRWYRQEYLTDFSDAIGAVFSDSDISAAESGDVRPLRLW